jgi:hypothetical protein
MHLVEPGLFVCDENVLGEINFIQYTALSVQYQLCVAVGRFPQFGMRNLGIGRKNISFPMIGPLVHGLLDRLLLHIHHSANLLSNSLSALLTQWRT